MKVAGKEVVKQLLGEVPFTAELYWLLRQRGKPLQSRFSLRHLQTELPEMVQQAELLREVAGLERQMEISSSVISPPAPVLIANSSLPRGVRSFSMRRRI